MTSPNTPASSAASSISPSGSITPAGNVTPASSVTPARSVAPASASDPAIAPTTESAVSTAQASSRVFPLMGVGALPGAALPADHPQVVAARASEDGSATLDVGQPVMRPVAGATASGNVPSPASASGSASIPSV